MADRRYFVLDFCGGGELFSYMHSRKKLGNDEAKFYLAEVVLALEAIHNQSMIYRDLKPENIVRCCRHCACRVPADDAYRRHTTMYRS